MSKSKIEWTEKTWNPITGCSKVSEGCRNCYAETMSNRLKAIGLKEYQQVINKKRFNGHINLIENKIEQPLHWKKTSKIFVNSMSDLFHKDVPLSFINKIWSIMKRTERHTYQILTKRPERAFECLMGNYVLKNVWIGVSIENQTSANLRRESFKKIPAKIKFISYEPALQKIDWSGWEFVDWMIAGGESGHHASPCHPDWIRSARDWSEKNNIPFLFKQWGQFIPSFQAGEKADDIASYKKTYGHRWVKNRIEFPDGLCMVKVGKKAAGRILDGKIYNQYPGSADG